MNKTEQAFARMLELRHAGGDIPWWAFEPITLKLAPDTRYTPDFATIEADGNIVFYEVKGFWRDDAKVKIKVAADKFWMFRFVIVQKVKGGWSYKEIGAPSPADADNRQTSFVR